MIRYEQHFVINQS